MMSTSSASTRDVTRIGQYIALLASLCLLVWAGCSGGSAPPADSGPGEAAEESATDDGGDSGMGNAEDNGSAQAAAMAQGAAADAPAEPEVPGEAPFDTSFLNRDTEFFVHARVGDILESSLVQMLTGGNLESMDEFSDELGVAPQDIETVTIGVSNLVKLSETAAKSLSMMNPMGPMGPEPGFDDPDVLMNAEVEAEMAEEEIDVEIETPDGDEADFDEGGAVRSSGPSGDVVAVVRTKEPIDVERFEGQGNQRVPHGSKAFYRMPQTGAKEQPCAYLVDNKTLVVSDETTIKEVIDQGTDRPRPTADLGFVETAPHLMLAIVPRDKAAFFRQGESLPFPGSFAGLSPLSGDPTGDASGMMPPPAGLSSGQQMQQGRGAQSGPTSAPPPGNTPTGSPIPPQQGRGAAHPQSGQTSAGSPGFGPSAQQQMQQQQTQQRQAAHAQSQSSSQQQMRMMQGGSPTGADQSAGSGSASGQSHFEEHADAFALLIDLSAGIGLDVVIKCDDPQAAEQIQAEIDQGLSAAKGMFEDARPTLPGVIGQVAQPVVDSLSASTSETVVSISASLPEEQQTMLPMVPMALMGMVMGGMEMSGDIDMGPGAFEINQEVLESGQTASNADELPEGLELQALARWGQNSYGDQAPPSLEIRLVATGGPAAEAVALGKLSLNEALASEASPLKWVGTTTESFSQDVVTEMVPIERDGMLSDHPDGGVATGVSLLPPADGASSLQRISGQFVMSVPGQTEDVMIANLQQLPGGRVDDDRLAAAGMTVVIQPESGHWEVSYAESPEIGQVQPVSADGAPLDSAGAGWSSSGGRKTLSYVFPGGIPSDTGLRVTLYSDVQEVIVPFRFENLPMPGEPLELTPDQQALLVWTSAEVPENIEGVNVQAQGRWRTLERVMDAEMSGNFSGEAFGQEARDFAQFESLDDAERDPDEVMEEAMAERAQQGFGGRPGGQTPGGSQRARGNNQRLTEMSANPLQVVVDLTGPLPTAAEAIGMVEVTSVKTDIDTELSFEGADFSGGFGDPVEDFVEVDRDMSFTDDGPPDGLRLVLKLTPPLQPISGLSQLTASVQLRTVRERTEAILTDLQERVGTPQGDSQIAAKQISNRDLLKLGLKPVVAIEPTRVRMALLEGREERISEVTLLDLNGLPLTNVFTSTEIGQQGATRGKTVYVFDFDGGVPQKIGMKISVNMGVNDITIPIRIRDLPLPPRPADE